MDFRAGKLQQALTRLDEMLGGLMPRIGSGLRPAAERWRADAAALRFHLNRPRSSRPVLVVVLGGTGTGKSTLVNRLLGQGVSATSFRRTFTSGAVAVAGASEGVPEEWLGVPHVVAAADQLPVRGKAGELVVVPVPTELTERVTLVDTPDLDGDQPAHHAEADRAFRWAEAVLFLVTPEKYQMTELLPYYRLASRYAVPSLFVMNKCEEQAVVEDYRQLLRVQNPDAQYDQGGVFAVARDDAGFEPPAGQNLEALREAVGRVAPVEGERSTHGLRQRADDLLGRLVDQVIAPLREERRQIDRLMAQLRGMEAPVPGVDVNPLTQQLQRRLQQRSVLYLMGPQRVLDRVRQAPGLLVRLPRVAWDYLMHGEVSAAALAPQNDGKPRQVPDFATTLTDQFMVLQGRIDDALRANPAGRRLLNDLTYRDALVPPQRAGQIAEEELAELRNWLEHRWNATPRDTRALQTLLKYLPGGAKIAAWTEAAPYLLVLVLVAATHHLLAGVDLAVIGGWSIATWLTERLSNEVTSHTRTTNQKIADRFTRLAHEQIESLCNWLDAQAPAAKSLDLFDAMLDGAREQMGEAVATRDL